MIFILVTEIASAGLENIRNKVETFSKLVVPWEKTLKVMSFDRSW